MRLGITLDLSKPLPDIAEEVRQLRDSGFHTASAAQIFGYDALTMLAVVGAEVPDIELMTAVVPTYPRHPIVLAAQALTVQAATSGRLALGIGLSHQLVVEGVFGYSFDRPVHHMHEYLQALLPLLRGEPAQFVGDTVRATTLGPIEIDAPAPPVLLAALGPRMLAIAGSLADGTITWMTGPATLESHTIPSITRAAQDAGRPEPRVVASFPVCVTGDVDAARARASKTFSIYGQLPSYRAMLDREGAQDPGDVAIVGDADEVRAQIAHLESIGVTDFVAAVYGTPDERDATMALLRSLAAGR
jgi:F420-dependent oxidoreductase-like protein